MVRTRIKRRIEAAFLDHFLTFRDADVGIVIDELVDDVILEAQHNARKNDERGHSERYSGKSDHRLALSRGEVSDRQKKHNRLLFLHHEIGLSHIAFDDFGPFTICYADLDVDLFTFSVSLEQQFALLDRKDGD